MRIKKYEAPSVHEALKLIKADLGPDAVILDTRSVRKNGPFGFLEKPIIEITAAIESDPIDLVKQIDGLSRKERPAVQLTDMSPASPWSNGRYGLERDTGLREELEKIKQMISSLQDEERAESKIKLSNTASSYYQGMIKSGVDPFISLRLLEGLEKMHPSRDGIDPSKWRNNLAKALAGLIKVTGPFSAGKESAVARHLLLGPTGVGKTTTLVKLAAQFTLVQKKKVALINIDNYRIGAAEQLKIYSQIIGVPMESVSDSDSFQNALKKFAVFDLIFIDSTGRSQKDVEQLKAMEEYVPGNSQINCHLVLSATTKDRDLREVINNYRCLNIESFIFTKIDESNSFGEIVNQCVRAKKPLSYLTTGQKVPEDLELASAQRVTELVLKDICLLGAHTFLADRRMNGSSKNFAENGLR